MSSTGIQIFQDYDDDDPDLEKRKNRWIYWEALKKIRAEFIENTIDGNFDAMEFEAYLEHNYGIKMKVVDGNITDGFIVTDEQKYLIFLLKF